MDDERINPEEWTIRINGVDVDFDDADCIVRANGDVLRFEYGKIKVGHVHCPETGEVMMYPFRRMLVGDVCMMNVICRRPGPMLSAAYRHASYHGWKISVETIKGNGFVPDHVLVHRIK